MVGEPDLEPDPDPEPDVDGIVDPVPPARGPPAYARLTAALPEPPVKPAARVVPRPEVTFFGILAAGLRPLRAEQRMVGRPLRMACSSAIDWRRNSCRILSASAVHMPTYALGARLFQKSPTFFDSTVCWIGSSRSLGKRFLARSLSTRARSAQWLRKRMNELGGRDGCKTGALVVSVVGDAAVEVDTGGAVGASMAASDEDAVWVWGSTAEGKGRIS